MKSEFILAFNEICEQRGLSKDVVFDLLQSALVSAYRRNTNVSNTQEVQVEIDERTGEPTIYAEKEVVDSVVDDRTEVRLEDALRQGLEDAQLGETVMVESTPRNFGRIAAQTAKQVILQRVREAEREQLFEDFVDREGEIINGTVQSIGGQHITIGLGRTEAILPRSQQVRRERYRAHDKIRVYVLEVRRTNRGPQIVVSRNHRNLLRRLLELEVPEIYNGQVEIKSIAREAGARSKVAVAALQEGVDPVGACVGMRGVRIQSIVRELNDEKIDVIEWNPDQKTFIAKALSPARVSQVYLEDHPDSGKTAIVVVPDDQLSLAIGREGQNARLAAKLTGWRIDIKSLAESAVESLNNLDHEAVDEKITGDEELVEKVRHILAKKEAGRPITAEDYMVLDRFVAGVEGRILAQRAAEFEQLRKARAEARKQVPEGAWDLDLEVLDLPLSVHNKLLDKNVDTVGQVLYRHELGDEKLLELGLTEENLSAVKGRVTEFEEEQREEAVAVDAVVEEVETAEEAAAIEEAAVTAEVDAEKAEIEAVVEPVAAREADVAEEIEEEAEPAEEVAVAAEEEEVAEEEEEEEEAIPAIDDLAKPLVEPTKPKKKEEKKGKVVVVRKKTSDYDEDAQLEEDEEDTDRHRKGKQLVYNEDAGRVVVKRKRKHGRRRPAWEEMEDMDVDEILEDEY